MFFISGWDGQITSDDHFLTHINEKTKLCLHFYMKEVSTPQLSQLERNLLLAEEFGLEVRNEVFMVLGIVMPQNSG